MQKREKILLGILLGSLLVGWLIPKMWNSFQDPVQILKSRRDSTLKKVKGQQDQIMTALMSQRKKAQWKKQSLPPNPQQAALLYQQWLHDLTESVGGFQEVHVVPERVSESRDRSFSLIRIRVSGRARFQQLKNYLYQFDRINLMHRIVELKASLPRITRTPNSTEGEETASARRPSSSYDYDAENPVLDIEATFEAISFPDAPTGDRFLFPRSELASRISSNSDEIEVIDAEWFPIETPFRIRVGSEYLLVTEQGESTWKVTRGFDLSSAQSHSAQTIVEYAPIHPDAKLQSDEDLRKLIPFNPFEKPQAPTKPSLKLSDQLSFPRDEELTVIVRPQDFSNATSGSRFPVEFEVQGKSLPKTLTWKTSDDNQLQMTWKPDETDPPQKHELKVLASQQQDDRSVFEASSEFTLTYNSTPVLKKEEMKTLLPGDSVKVVFEATDMDLPFDKLTYEVTNLPDGAVFDAETRTLSWSPAVDTQGKQFDLKVKVQDTLEASDEFRLTLKVDDDPAAYTILTFTGTGFGKNGTGVAWLKNRQSGTKTELSAGEKFKIGSINGTLLEIEEDAILVKVGEAEYRVMLGKAIREMKKLSNSKSKPETKTETESKTEDM